MGRTFRIGVFTYDFPHYRTQQGLLKLLLSGLKPDILFAQPYKKLTFHQSEIRFSPSYTDVPETRDLAAFFDIPYTVCDHNSAECAAKTREMELDIGVILGARILKKDTIEAFGTGIINPHPGIIPINRGLDNLKWAIVQRIPQAVTTHLIDPRIDMGRMIDLQTMDVFRDDTLIDLHIRQQELMHKMTVEAIRKLQQGFKPVPVTDQGIYHHAMDADTEATLMEQFEPYKRDYPVILAEWKRANERTAVAAS